VPTHRAKATVYIDRDLLRAVKVLAASSGRHDYEVLEDALRQYLGSPTAESTRRELRDLLARVGQRSDLTDGQALELAYEELHAARRARRP
jgi:hypothetical protein